MQNNRPIGVFDSGIGGLTVARGIVEALPHERLIYFGDTAHLPYGDKSADAIRYYCLRIGKFLVEKNCKAIVIACNSASTAGYRTLLDFFADRAVFVNVVDPLVRAVAAQPFRKVGVIATKATVRSNVYAQQLQLLRPDLEVVSIATPLLAPMIEEGFVHNAVSSAVLREYLGDPRLGGIDALLLACTHYPLIREAVAEQLPEGVRIYDSIAVVADDLHAKLAARDLLATAPQGGHHFYVSDYTASFEAATRVFYPDTVQLEHVPVWG